MQTNVGKSNARATMMRTMMATDAEQEEENAEHNQILLALHFNFAERIDANESRVLHNTHSICNREPGITNKFINRTMRSWQGNVEIL